jgi:hypothetical protein
MSGSRAGLRGLSRELGCGSMCRGWSPAWNPRNGWTLAERTGEVSPDGTQRLLRSADRNVNGVRDDVRDYVVEHLA